MEIIIRLAQSHDLEEIQEVERTAGQRFDAYPILLPEIDEEDAGTEHEQDLEYIEGISEKRLWVAVTPQKKIIGFALAQVIDSEGHLREIDVLQDFGRQGIGRVLINTVREWCHSKQLNSLTLTTFKEIPWNCPYYTKLGFFIIEDIELSGKLKEMIADERATFALERVAMRMILNG